ncbi:globin domain-containing protein [uncultured Roseobacter sp.]|uniref:globin domain-containing protein n=1 Tax=uncultured Roseobacter sp. TaxID=114847 RepID=UPI00263402EE|nr:globin domain-containing protein [uncultured Roseobacter sp.]
MDLTQDDIDIIRASYMQLSSDLQRSGDVFYEALFDIAPETRDLFLADMSSQAMKLMSTIGLVVSQLQNSQELEPVVKDLALRHLAYGVEEKHYAQVREALLKMLSVVLDSAYSEEARTAWGKAYDGLANVMVRVAYPERKGKNALVNN